MFSQCIQFFISFHAAVARFLQCSYLFLDMPLPQITTIPQKTIAEKL